MVLGKAPELSETRQYLADSNLMPALEAGIAEMLKATQGEGSRQDGVNYLAQCMRALSLSCDLSLARLPSIVGQVFHLHALTLTLVLALAPDLTLGAWRRSEEDTDGRGNGRHGLVATRGWFRPGETAQGQGAQPATEQE